jgi:opacity protein-like surface antigen
LILRKIVVSAALAAFLATTVAASASAQETDAKPNNIGSPPSATSGNAPALTGPSLALRQALSAACRQDETEFTKYLTTRNAQTFGSLTAGARVALMKRFVLLNEPGKPSLVTGAAGRPLVRCETPVGAAELQIGGADVDDNLALLPVEIRDATDASGESVLHVKMGLVRERGEWKLISVGLVLLDLPSLAVEWDSAQIGETEKTAIESLKTIAAAVEQYRRTYTRLPESLAVLAAPAKGAPTTEAAGMLDDDLAAGARSGYNFRYVLESNSTLGAPAKFALAATPQVYGRTGKRSFLTQGDGVIHGADRQGGVGTASDPRITDAPKTE